MKQAAFPRVILCSKCWAGAPDGSVFASADLSIGGVAEVFGPPDRYRQTERWAFVDRNGNACAIIAHSRNAKPSKPIRMDFVGDRSFFDWATAKVNLTENADLPPAFLMASR